MGVEAPQIMMCQFVCQRGEQDVGITFAIEANAVMWAFLGFAGALSDLNDVGLSAALEE